MSDLGLLSEVVAEPRGSFLTADVVALDTTLFVDDAGDFDDEGGVLELNGERLTYTGITFGETRGDPDEITLETGPTEAATTDDSVSVVQADAVAVDYWAWVAMDEGDPVMVPLRYDQLAGWPVQQYDPPVPVAVAEDLSGIEDAPGRSLSSAVQFYQDTHVVTEAGEQSVQLTYLPIDNSEHLYWHPADQAGIYQSGDQWSRDGQVITVPDELGLVAVGDSIAVEYAYLLGATAFVPEPEPEPEPDPDPDATVIVPTNVVELNDSPSYEGSIVGSPPQWGDDDEATGAVFRSKFGTGTGNRYQGVETLFDDEPSLVVDLDARIALWYIEDFNDHPYGLRISFKESSLASGLVHSPSGANGLLAPAGWSVIELIPAPGRTIGTVLNTWKTTPMGLGILPGAASPDPPGTYHTEISISEVRIAIYYP